MVYVSMGRLWNDSRLFQHASIEVSKQNFELTGFGDLPGCILQPIIFGVEFWLQANDESDFG
jgi:hypothetical protein